MDVWHGREWEDYCVSLLQKRYAIRSPHSLQLVPAKDRGDLGLEAFSHEGYGYQCYAAEEPLATGQLYEKQRDKLTTDLGKLEAKSGDIHKMLGPVVIHRYVFMVHRHDSRQLITHAQTKAAELVELGLPFISRDFRIVIETASDYVAERAELHAIPKPLITVPDVEAAETAAWMSENPGLLTVAGKKLAKIIDSPGTRDAVLETLLDQYLEGENALEKLRTFAPEGHQAVLIAKAQREKLLILKYPSASLKTQGAMVDIASAVQTAFVAANPLLDAHLAETLAWASIADWLMRCPLDFGGTDE